MLQFFMDNWLVITFYLLVILLLYIFRSKFEWQGIAGLLRTNTGLKWMTKTGRKYPKTIKVVASIGVVVGFLGMIIIVGYLIYGLYSLFALPNAPPVVSPVLPGVAIPGTGISLPLFEGIIALFISVLIHEAAHGLVAAAYKIKIKSSGFALFGPIPAAFVEPDEKKMEKQTAWTQLSIFAAGPWSNILLTIVAYGLFIGVVMATAGFAVAGGAELVTVQEQGPAALAGLDEGVIITQINDIDILSSNDFITALSNTTPNQSLTFYSDQQQYNVTLGSYENNDDACLGVNLQTARGNEDISNTHPILFYLLQLVQNIIFWTFVLSMGLGLANLMPLGPIDGGRMLLTALETRFKAKQAKKIWGTISYAFLALVLVLLFVPIIRSIFFSSVSAALCLPV